MALITWLLIAAFIFILLLVFKAKEVRHKMEFLIVALLCLFLIFSFLQIYKTHKVNLKTFNGVVTAGKLYVAWLGQMFHNLADITGYAVHRDWSFNSTKVK
jgi:amino acid permease